MLTQWTDKVGALLQPFKARFRRDTARFSVTQYAAPVARATSPPLPIVAEFRHRSMASLASQLDFPVVDSGLSFPHSTFAVIYFESGFCVFQRPRVTDSRNTGNDHPNLIARPRRPKATAKPAIIADRRAASKAFKAA